MPIYKLRREARYYGHAIGILLIDHADPGIPGDVCNASTYKYPVLFQVVSGLAEQVFTGNPECLGTVTEAAKELERKGVRGITSNCGFMIHYQEGVARVVNIPVFLSSLLQIPLIDKSLNVNLAIGIITASSEHLTNELLTMAGASPNRRIHIESLWDKLEFRSVIVEQGGILNSDKLQEEVVQVAQNFVRSHPDIGRVYK